MDEIKRLAATHYEGEDTALQRAFLFCCFTGIRWCDTVSLTYANVDFSAKILRFNQQKTEGRSAHSGVTIPLSPTLLKLIGNPIQHTSEKNIQYHLLPHNRNHTLAEMGKGSRNQQDYHMALRPPQFRCKCAWCRSEHQDCCLSNGTFKHQDDREISTRHRPAEAGRNQQPRRP